MEVLILIIIIVLVGAVMLAPFVVMLIGIIMRFSQEQVKREKGKKLLLRGAILLAAEVLIGFAICSTMDLSLH